MTHKNRLVEGQNVQITKGNHKGMIGEIEQVRTRKPRPYYINIRGNILLYSAHEIRGV
jgi:transcription antitermination factor NusG